MAKTVKQILRQSLRKDRIEELTSSLGLDTEPPELVGVDEEMSLYELTDLFYAYYRYHNDDYLVDYEYTHIGPDKQLQKNKRSLSRFQALRRIEAARLGSRPFLGGKGVAAHKPNVSLGYMRLLLDYLVLPYKSVFTDSDLVRVQVNRRLYNEEKVKGRAKEELDLAEQNNPNMANNKEISDDVSDAYVDVLRTSRNVNRCLDTVSLRIVQDGLIAFVHSDLDWRPTPTQAIDFITEPQADYYPDEWSTFFVIRKMNAQEAVKHIRENTQFWNTNALRWALENARENRGLLNSRHYNSFHYRDEDDKVCRENFSVKSFYNEKASRTTNIGSYYGNMLVVEAYYTNKKGKINKAIFFPSDTFLNVPRNEQVLRTAIAAGLKDVKITDNDRELFKEAEFGDILFHRNDVFDSMREAVTVIPFDRSELSLERQRGFGHELFSPIEILMRLDTAILNFANLMGVPFFKNRAQGTDAQDLLDLEIMVNGDMVDLGDRDFVQPPFQANLNDMLGVRNVLLQHIRSKGFLGGLDGNEMMQNGRGANLANLRLVRDGRVHKHNIEGFAEGLREFYTTVFKGILKLEDSQLLDEDVLVQKLFYDTLFKVHGYSERLFKFDKDEIIPDTGLPYWMQIEAIRNGASHFGAAELVLYSEIKQVFGDGLDQRSLQALNRMGIKSLLGSQDALDILGDPKDNIVTEKDQVYRATTETVALIGSVTAGVLSMESIPILEDKDDHVAHLTQSHNPKAEEIIQRLQANEVTPEFLAEASEDVLETRNDMILQLGALGNHISLHANQLDRFGNKRPDINRLKEETNAILQSVEGLMNSLQISLRALQAKRQEQQMRLQNLSPENEAARMEQENKMMELQAKMAKNQQDLEIANKLMSERKQQHIDKQLTKSRDRATKERIATREQNIKMMELQQQGEQDRREAATQLVQ